MCLCEGPIQDEVQWALALWDVNSSPVLNQQSLQLKAAESQLLQPLLGTRVLDQSKVTVLCVYTSIVSTDLGVTNGF